MMVSERAQWVAFSGLSLGTVALTIIAHLLNPRLFQRFLGGVNPVLAIVAICAIGFVLVGVMLSRDWFVVWAPARLARFVVLAGLAAALAIPMIVVDSKVVFPADLNVLLPQSLLYYPVIDYAVQIIFHLLPLSLLLALMGSIFSSAPPRGLLWSSVLLVSALEPILQATFFAGEYPSWTVALIGVQVFVFGAIELALLLRYDFISAYWFRLAYYSVWHLVWGNLRLQLLC